jgi:hypothetical protein
MPNSGQLRSLPADEGFILPRSGFVQQGKSTRTRKRLALFTVRLFATLYNCFTPTRLFILLELQPDKHQLSGVKQQLSS